MTGEPGFDTSDQSVRHHATALLARAQDMADVLRSEAEKDAAERRAEVADLVNWIRAEWGGQAGPVTAEQVRAQETVVK